MNRLNELRTNSRFTTCQDCGFTYLPMNQHTKTNCPKCRPKIIDDDEMYLQMEEKSQEIVCHDDIELTTTIWERK